jgi:hypothetical protein
MSNISKGRGLLRAPPPSPDEFEVDYEIHFGSTTTAQALGGIPAPSRTTITEATTIRAVDGRSIPEGQYILTDRRLEFHLAKGFNGKWYLR